MKISTLEAAPGLQIREGMPPGRCARELCCVEGCGRGEEAPLGPRRVLSQAPAADHDAARGAQYRTDSGRPTRR